MEPLLLAGQHVDQVSANFAPGCNTPASMSALKQTSLSAHVSGRKCHGLSLAGKTPAQSHATKGTAPSYCGALAVEFGVANGCEFGDADRHIGRPLPAGRRCDCGGAASWVDRVSCCSAQPQISVRDLILLTALLSGNACLREAPCMIV